MLISRSDNVTPLGDDVSQMHQSSAPCVPVINLSFIKIHHTGSETFHNALVNFAIKHNAFVALGDCKWYQVFPYQLSNGLLLPSPRQPAFNGYNMFFDHVLFNRTASDQVLPSGTVYITQIRHPFSHAFSAYEHMGHIFKLEKSYAEFLSSPAKYEQYIRFGGNCRNATQRPMEISPSRNVMALELGYTNQAENNISTFQLYLRKLDSELLHVSILEDLPVSMVLLKHKLCWKFQDILHLLHKIRHVPFNSTLLEKQEKIHREWNSLDYALYEFFLERHKREVAAQPPAFHREVAEYIRVQETFTQFCGTLRDALARTGSKNITQIRHIMASRITFPSTEFYDTFHVSLHDCAMHMLREVTAKKVLLYHMHHHSCRKNPEVTDYVKVDCDVSQHVIPGLSAYDMNYLFKKKSNSSMNKKKPIALTQPAEDKKKPTPHTKKKVKGEKKPSGKTSPPKNKKN